MDFELTDEQRMFYDEVRKFVAKELVLSVEEYYEYDHNQKFIWKNWKKMADYGLLGLPYPEEYGGGGASALTTCLAMEAAARSGLDAGTLLSWGAHTILCGIPIWKLGTEEQKKKYLPALSSGEKIGGFALTEPEAGSDAASLRTTATRVEGGWVLNGTKMFITNGPIGSVFIVMAKTDKEKKALGISAFIVEKDFSGFSVGKELDKLGNRTSTTSELIFEDCFVPEENILGTENLGFVIVAKLILGWERSCLLAGAVGGIGAGMEASARYAQQRIQFRRPIAEFPAIQHKLADMKVAYEAGKQLIYRVASMLDRDEENLLDAAVSKEFITRASIRSADETVQIHGGYGYMREYLVERGIRDAKLASIGGGTSEIQLSIIARSLMPI